MNTTALATKPAHVLRTYTQPVRDAASAYQRVQDQYFAALKRAEAQYFDGVQRIADTIRTGVMTEPAADAASNGATQTPSTA